jgi:hypothetical protein
MLFLTVGMQTDHFSDIRKTLWNSLEKEEKTVFNMLAGAYAEKF